MKNVIAILFSVAFMSSCAIKEQKRIDMTQVTQIEDSIPNIVPGVRSIHTIQKDDDLSKVIIIVGAPSFYGAADDKKQQAAVNTGRMLLHVLGSDASITSAMLVITKKDQDAGTQVPPDGISLPIDIEAMKKTGK